MNLSKQRPRKSIVPARMEVRAPTTKEKAVRRPDLKSQTDAPDAVLPPVWLTSTTMMTEKMTTNIAQIWCVCVCVYTYVYYLFVLFMYLYIYLWYIYVYMSHYDDDWEDGYKYRVWCVYVCVCVYTCIYILHMYMFIYVCMYTDHTYIHAMFITSRWWLRRWRQESRTSDLCVCVCVCLCVCIQYIYMYIYMYILLIIYMNVCVTPRWWLKNIAQICCVCVRVYIYP